MSDSHPEIDDLLGATVAGKYRVDRLLGRGGMGAVYQATNLAINKRVALKFLDREAARDQDAVRRFQREAEAASAVESAHIVEIFDSGSSEDGRPFLVMELLRGEDLRTRLRREGRLSLDVALEITTQVLRGLSRAHRAGIIHRDLKPDNVFLCERDDSPLFVKIVDFGISKLARSASADTLTRRGTVLGTAFYMSPEQAQAYHDIDGRADLFSLGAIVYEALSGRPPHTGRVYEAVLVSICSKEAEDIRLHAPDVPAPVAAVIARAVARDREQRFGNAEQFLAAVEAAAAERPAPAESSPGPRPALEGRAPGSGEAVLPVPHAHGRRTLLVLLAAAAAAAGLGGALAWTMNRPDQGPAPATRASSLAKPSAAPSASTPASSPPSVVPPAVVPLPEVRAGAGGSTAAPARAAATAPARTRSAAPRRKPSGSRRAPENTPDHGGVLGGLESYTQGP